MKKRSTAMVLRDMLLNGRCRYIYDIYNGCPCSQGFSICDGSLSVRVLTNKYIKLVGEKGLEEIQRKNIHLLINIIKRKGKCLGDTDNDCVSCPLQDYTCYDEKNVLRRALRLLNKINRNIIMEELV